MVGTMAEMVYMEVELSLVGKEVKTGLAGKVDYLALDPQYSWVLGGTQLEGTL